MISANTAFFLPVEMNPTAIQTVVIKTAKGYFTKPFVMETENKVLRGRGNNRREVAETIYLRGKYNASLTACTHFDNELDAKRAIDRYQISGCWLENKTITGSGCK